MAAKRKTAPQTVPQPTPTPARTGGGFPRMETPLPKQHGAYMREPPAKGLMGEGSLFVPVFHPALCKIIIERVRGTGDLSRAATTLSIPLSLVHSWIRRGAEDDGTPEWPLYNEFLIRIEGALGDYESRLLRGISRAAEEGDWKAAVWLLQKQNPDRWGTEGSRKKTSDKENDRTLTQEEMWWMRHAPLTAGALKSGEAETPVVQVTADGAER